jgi:hypothetical protein
MAQPTTLTITYISTPPSTTSQVTIQIPTPIAGSVGGVAQTVVPQDFTQAVRNIFENGGFWFVSATGVNTFVPWGQITSITAQ